jgi:type I restriction enzyme S subunit
VVAPENWKTEKLPQICKFRSGKAHEQYVDAEGAFVLVNSKFISSDGQIRKFSSINRCLAKSGDVLMVMSDLPNGKALAKTYLVSEDNKFAVNQRVCSLSPYKDDSRFLFYALNRHPYFLAFDDGVSQTHLLNRVFLKCELTLPNSVKEQEAIAEALSDADAAIESLDALIVKKRDVKQATVQQLLTGRTRLPGFTEAWKVEPLGGHVLMLKGNGLSRSKLSDSGKFQALLYGELFTVYERVICTVKSQTNSDEGIASLFGDVLMPGSTTTTGEDLATASALLQDDVRIGGDVNIIRPNLKKIDPRWLAYRITNCHRRDVGSITQGITIHHLYGREIASLLIPFPALDEQKAIVEILIKMDDELEALNEQVSKLRMVKEGMMQDLLTGKVRLV